MAVSETLRLVVVQKGATVSLGNEVRSRWASPNMSVVHFAIVQNI